MCETVQNKYGVISVTVRRTEEGDNKHSCAHKKITEEEQIIFFTTFFCLQQKATIRGDIASLEQLVDPRHMGKSRDLSEFERGMIVGARNAGCSISETVRRLGFSKTAVSRVYREWCEKQKTSSHRGSCGRKRLVDETGERRLEMMVEANNQATSVQIQALYNSCAQEKPISLTTTRRTLKRLGYGRRAQRQDPFVLAGLEALAAYASCPGQVDTSADMVGRTEDRSDPETRSCADADTENRPEPSV